MELKEAIRNRRSIRVFKPDPVKRERLEAIMDTARWSGSGMNMQPWEFMILGGEKMEVLRDALANATGPAKLEFASGMPVPEAQEKRAAEYRETSDSYNFPPGTEDVDTKRKALMDIRSRLSNAPHVIILYSDKSIVNSPWGFYSMGLISQSICLAALDYGLGTCIISGPSTRPDIVREICGIPEDKTIVISIIIGYPDPDARINNVPRTRLPIDKMVSMVGF